MSDPNNVYTISIKQVGENEKTWWKSCGVAFLNVDDADGRHARPRSIAIRLDLFPGRGDCRISRAGSGLTFRKTCRGRWPVQGGRVMSRR